MKTTLKISTDAMMKPLSEMCCLAMAGRKVS